MNTETFLQTLDANTEEIKTALNEQRGRLTELTEEQERVERLIHTLEGRLVQNGDIRRYMGSLGEGEGQTEVAPQEVVPAPAD